MSDASFADGHPSFGRGRGAGSAIPGPAGPAGPGGAVISVLTVAVASASQLNTLASAGVAEGQLASVASLDDALFQLKPGARVVDNITVVNATGKPGFQWVRQALPQMLTPIRTAWAVDTGVGNDENTGAVGAPLKTVSELARRLAFNEFTVAVTATLTGNMAATDLPYFNFRSLAVAATFTLTGQPVLIHAGTVTTIVNPAAAPTADDTHMVDATIPVSFTASGLMAVGVVFHRTNGGASDWWAAKDLGGAAPAATLRISTPSVALANGDTYTASALPTVNVMHFLASAPGSVLLTQLSLAATSRWNDNSITFTRCWLPGCVVGGSISYVNCALSVAGGLIGALYGLVQPIGAGRFTFGMMRGTGAETYLIFPGASITFNSGRLTLQGAQLNNQGGFVSFNNPIAAYDVAAPGPLQGIISAHYNAQAASFLSGLNNAKLAFMTQTSFLSHVRTPFWVAGSSTDLVTPIVVNGTGGMTVAAESGGAGAMNAQQNGIFPTS